jgi:hypothetical protein
MEGKAMTPADKPRKQRYEFAGNDKTGLMRTIYVNSGSILDAFKAAKHKLTNPRLTRVG